MRDYRVTWTIDLAATSPREAARKALKVQRDPDSSALLFEVKEFDTDEDFQSIDLLDEEN